MTTSSSSTQNTSEQGSDTPLNSLPSPQSNAASSTAVPSSSSGFQITIPPYDDRLDATKHPNRPIHGWPEIAKLIADTPDFEAFQSFKDLQIKSLLYYQAELALLRQKLDDVEYDDYRRGESIGVVGASKFGTRLDSLFLSGNSDNPRVCK
jgi:hypothetical protein